MFNKVKIWCQVFFRRHFFKKFFFNTNNEIVRAHLITCPKLESCRLQLLRIQDIEKCPKMLVYQPSPPSLSQFQLMLILFAKQWKDPFKQEHTWCRQQAD